MWLQDDLSVEEKRKAMQCSLRGEMKAVDNSTRFSFRDHHLMRSLLSASLAASGDEAMLLRGALSPALMGRAAQLGDLKWLEALRCDGFDPRQGDTDGRTPLHHAAAAGRESAATLLLRWGVPVHVRDRRGGTPLLDALWGRHWPVARLLARAGAGSDAVVAADPRRVADELVRLCADDDVAALSVWLECGASAAAPDVLGRTPLHAVRNFFSRLRKKVINNPHMLGVFERQ